MTNRTLQKVREALEVIAKDSVSIPDRALATQALKELTKYIERLESDTAAKVRGMESEGAIRAQEQHIEGAYYEGFVDGTHDDCNFDKSDAKAAITVIRGDDET